MAVYIIGREGIWPLHNLMRAPILIESDGYPEGYPRGDYRRMDILHDGGTWFIVYLEGTTEFEKTYLDIEPLSDNTMEGLMKKIYQYADSKEESLRTQIARDIRDHMGEHVSEKEVKEDFDQNIEQKIRKDALNAKFVFERPSKNDIIERNLRP